MWPYSQQEGTLPEVDFLPNLALYPPTCPGWTHSVPRQAGCVASQVNSSRTAVCLPCHYREQDAKGSHTRCPGAHSLDIVIQEDSKEEMRKYYGKYVKFVMISKQGLTNNSS